MLCMNAYSEGDDAACVAIHNAADSGSDALDLGHLVHMTAIPECAKLLRDQLEVLSLDNNYSLRELPPLLGDFPRLRCLNASYSRLESISPAISRLSRLTRLQLSNNSLTFLPPELGQLKRLEELQLDNNKLRVLPGGLVFVRTLRELTVENNPLYTPEQTDGAAHVTLVPPQASVDCANCCVRVRNYQVLLSFHRLPSYTASPLPFVFFLCSAECHQHLQGRLALHDRQMSDSCAGRTDEEREVTATAK